MAEKQKIGVDVLAVMDMTADMIECKVRPVHLNDGDLREARAAVAELIEVSAAIARYMPAQTDKVSPFRVPSVKWERWRAALARVQGG